MLCIFFIGFAKLNIFQHRKISFNYLFDHWFCFHWSLNIFHSKCFSETLMILRLIFFLWNFTSILFKWPQHYWWYSQVILPISQFCLFTVSIEFSSVTKVIFSSSIVCQISSHHILSQPWPGSIWTKEMPPLRSSMWSKPWEDLWNSLNFQWVLTIYV